MKKDFGIHTRVIRAGTNPDTTYGSIVPPIYQTSTFKFESAEQGRQLFEGTAKGYIYTRIGNPTIDALESALAELENGTAAQATSTGMAAIMTVYFSLLSKGDHLVATDAIYGSARLAMENEFSRFGVDSSFVDSSDLAKVRAAMTPATRLVYIESPANPTLKLTDIRGCAEIAHAHGALLAVDNTFMCPVLQNPLDLGADIVIHSLTKFINGHTDIVGGAIITKDPALDEQIRSIRHYMGGTMDPHQAWLVIRGLRTLALRVERAQENAVKMADWLNRHPAVETVYFPGLPEHPQYEVGQSQARGPGAMISFDLKGGYDAGVQLMDSVRVATLAVSLGGYESLIQHPASMTHSWLPAETRQAAGIGEGLVRLSVGCESIEDLIQDFDQALAGI